MVVDGMATALPFHRLVVRDEAFTAEPFTVHTRWIETEFDTPMPDQDTAQAAAAAGRETVTVEVGGKRLEVVVPAGFGMADRGGSGPKETERARISRRSTGRSAAAGSGATLVSPMQGTIIKIEAGEGQRVSAGDVVVVLEAMKMEQPLTAHKDGTVTGLSVEIGQTVSAGAAICELVDLLP
jgi:acetyl-CoA/propionyl-CoA carboxylase biotin carboxyl carrier protein